MAHRSVPQPVPPVDDDAVDPFWHEAFHRRPPLWERVADRARPVQSWLVAAVGIVAVATVGWWMLRPGAPPIEASLPAAEAASAAPAGAATTVADAVTTSTAPTDVVVQAAGAVAKPGVYELPVGARVDDLVKAAGGLTDRADADRVNLAAPVADGERVWVPSEGQDAVPDVVAGTAGGSGAGPSAAGGSGGGGGASAAPSAPVDLNSATAEELDALPGVGPATATAILSYRDEHGRFSSVDELLEVRGIGEAKLDQLRSLVRV